MTNDISHLELLLTLLSVQDGEHARIVESSIDDEDDALFPTGSLFL